MGPGAAGAQLERPQALPGEQIPIGSAGGTRIAKPCCMAEELRDRLARLARDPRHTEFAHKLADALAGIRRDFQGDARERLEEMIDEALERQLQRVENRERAEVAMAGLETSQAELVSALYGVLLRLVPDEGATRH